MPAAALANLANDPEVAYITPDRPVRSFLDNTAAAVNAPTAWQYGWKGSGIGVAVIDSGIKAGNQDLRDPATNTARVVYSESFTPGDVNDAYGHGTHVAGIVGGNAANSSGSGKYTKSFYGMAPQVSLINLQVLDGNGAGTDSAVIAALSRAVALKNTYHIRVINLSLGRPVFESYTVDPLCEAVEAAWQAGIVVVVAAGNNGRDNSAGTSGYATITAPGNDPLAITVGAMKTMGTPSRGDDLIASYSSKGPTLIDHIVKPDLVAPGNKMIWLSASRGMLNNSYPQNIVPLSYYTKVGNTQETKNYFWLSGTSMATGVLSGAAALMLQKNPELTPDQVKARLMKTATKNFPAVSIATDPATGVTYKNDELSDGGPQAWWR